MHLNFYIYWTTFLNIKCKYLGLDSGVLDAGARLNSGSDLGFTKIKTIQMLVFKILRWFKQLRCRNIKYIRELKHFSNY